MESVRPHCRSVSHAYRCLDNRWLAIAWKVRQTHQCYNESYQPRQRAIRTVPLAGALNASQSGRTSAIWQMLASYEDQVKRYIVRPRRHRSDLKGGALERARLGGKTLRRLFGSSMALGMLERRVFAPTGYLESTLAHPMCHAKHDPQHFSFAVLKRPGEQAVRRYHWRVPRFLLSVSPIVASLLKLPRGPDNQSAWE